MHFADNSNRVCALFGQNTVISLGRSIVALLAPMVFILAVAYARQRPTDSDGKAGLTVRYARLVPWFVWGFLALALLNTLGLLPTLNFQLADIFSGAGRPVSASVTAVLTAAGKLLLTVAMAAIGLEVSVRQLAGVGGRAVTAGIVATVVLGAVSLALIFVLI